MKESLTSESITCLLTPVASLGACCAAAHSGTQLLPCCGSVFLSVLGVLSLQPANRERKGKAIYMRIVEGQDGGFYRFVSHSFGPDSIIWPCHRLQNVAQLAILEKREVGW